MGQTESDSDNHDDYTLSNSTTGSKSVISEDPAENQLTQKWIRQIQEINLKRFEKVKYVPKARNYLDDFNNYFNLGISPHVFIESLMSVFLEGRIASCCFSDQIYSDLTIEQIELLAKRIKEDYNIFMDIMIIPHLASGIMVIFFFKDINCFDKTRQLQELSVNYASASGSIFSERKGIELWGEILGYPACCINFCIKSRENKEEIELKCSQMLQQIETTQKKDTASIILSSAYFSLEFYPCRPDCAKAISIGKKIYKIFYSENKFLSEAFALIRKSNQRRVSLPYLNSAQNSILRKTTDRNIHKLFLQTLFPPKNSQKINESKITPQRPTSEPPPQIR